MAPRVAGREAVLLALAEAFREYGYEGASLALIGARTGLGKGSLYHFSPGGRKRWRRPCSTRSTAGLRTPVPAAARGGGPRGGDPRHAA